MYEGCQKLVGVFGELLKRYTRKLAFKIEINFCILQWWNSLLKIGIFWATAVQYYSLRSTKQMFYVLDSSTK